MELPAPTAEERSAGQRRHAAREGPAIIGFGRDLTALLGAPVGPREFVWGTNPDGSAAAAVVLVSPGASAVRAQLLLKSVPHDLEAGFYDPGDVEGTAEWVSAAELAATPSPGDGGYLYWSPTVTGERIGIELRIASGSWRGVAVTVPRISHLDETLDDFGSSSKSTCEQTDAVCRSDRISDTARSAVAKYLYTTASGDTSNCTGTLLNDQDLATQIPYFVTADHCMQTEAEVASTEFHWFHEAPVCGDPGPPTTLQQGRGATLLAREGWYICTGDDPYCPGSDMLLMRLQ